MQCLNMKYHYTYRISNIKEGMHYYGVRSCDRLPKEDIGVKYLSTSLNKAFIQDQKDNPQDYKYKVIKIFSSRVEAVEHEIFLHAKFNVKLHDSFYNDANQTSTGFDTTGKRYTRTPEQIINYRNCQLGKTYSKEVNMKKGRLGELNGMYGKNHTEETKEKMRKPKSEETKEKMKISQLLTPIVKCDFCDTIGRISIMKRWHFNNCKYKLKEII